MRRVRLEGEMEVYHIGLRCEDRARCESVISQQSLSFRPKRDGEYKCGLKCRHRLGIHVINSNGSFSFRLGVVLFFFVPDVFFRSRAIGICLVITYQILAMGGCEQKHYRLIRSWENGPG